MPLNSYSIRNYYPDDFAKFAAFCRENKIFGKEENELTSDIIQKRLLRPDYSPSKDLFLTIWNENIVGFLNLTPELRIGRIISHGFIHPAHRRQGLATKMLSSGLKRAADVKAKVFHVCLSVNNIAAKALLRKCGFSPVRCFLELRIGLSEVFEKATQPSWLKIDTFKPREETQLTSIQNKCFTGMWGFCPNTEEEVRYYLDLTQSRLKDVMALRLRKDESILGYCWTQIIGRSQKVFLKRKGRIHMFGIDPDYQGKGLGRILLLAGLYYLKKKAAEAVELTVDKENKRACSLYCSLGFQTMSASYWYEKHLT